VSAPSDPQPPTASRPASTDEIPKVSTGATAVGKSLPPHPDAATPVPMAAVQPTGPVDFVPGPPGTPSLQQPPAAPVPPPPRPAPAVSPLLTPGEATPVPSAQAPPPPAQSAETPPPGRFAEVPPAEVSDAPTTASPAPSWPDTLESGIAAPAGPPARGRKRASPDRGTLAGLGLAALSVMLVLLGAGLDYGAESFWSAIPLWSAFATVCALLGLLAFAAAAAHRLRKERAERAAAVGLAGLAAFWLLVVLPDVATDRGFVCTAALACLGAALWIGARTRA
jgi:hypothetical protein